MLADEVVDSQFGHCSIPILLGLEIMVYRLFCKGVENVVVNDRRVGKGVRAYNNNEAACDLCRQWRMGPDKFETQGIWGADAGEMGSVLLVSQMPMPPFWVKLTGLKVRCDQQELYPQHVEVLRNFCRYVSRRGYELEDTVLARTDFMETLNKEQFRKYWDTHKADRIRIGEEDWRRVPSPYAGEEIQQRMMENARGRGAFLGRMRDYDKDRVKSKEMKFPNSRSTICALSGFWHPRSHMINVRYLLFYNYLRDQRGTRRP